MVKNKISSLSAVALTVLMMGTAPLTQANELSNTQQDGQLNFGYIVDEAPYSSATDGTKPTGFAVELCEKVEDTIKAAHNTVDLKVVYTPVTLEEGLSQVQSGDLDMLCGAVVETLSRRQMADFSTPISVGGITALINQDADATLKRVLEGEQAHTGPRWRATVNQGLANHTYAVHEGTVTEAWVRDQIKQLGVVATVVTAKTNEEGVKLVSEGKVDAYFADRSEIIAAIHTSSITNVELSPRIYAKATEHLVIAKGNSELRLLVDTVLSDLYQSDDFAPLHKKHFGDMGQAVIDEYQNYIIAK
ncbi:ABC transporter substrate-binding protein [Psychromonas marina]|uniref:ABC transporter substrate-binding protein n=1 Tax=Psychromonas marina TaxID=88364 RepID=A0ABQ6E3M5_9GAMM|nr:transporter substrate-binding domain-containing protein [Psychromonas marina]GLS91854.1 ABC transporter substrate-binding protein [Psychromonas marina]